MLVPSRCGAERVKRRCPGAAASAPRAAFPSVTRSEEGFILFIFFPKRSPSSGRRSARALLQLMSGR